MKLIQKCEFKFIKLTLSFIAFLSFTALCTPISDAEFNSIISFITTIDLETANDRDYQDYVNTLTYVEDNGNETQKEILTHILDGEEISEKIIEEDLILSQITDIFENDVITPSVWQDAIAKIQAIDIKGTSEQKALLKAFFNENKQKISSAIQGMVYNTFAQVEVKQAVQFITVNTIYGVVPSVAFKSAQYFIMGIDPVQASLELVDVGILSALDSLIRYGLQKMPALTSATVAAGLSTVTQDFLGFVGAHPANIPLLGAIGRPLIASLQAIVTTATMQEITRRGGIGKILRSMHWQNIVTPATTAVTTTSRRSYQIIKNQLIKTLQNKATREAIATVTGYAAEGALIGAVIHMLGLGFHEAGAMSLITLASFRGALEELYYASLKTNQQQNLINKIKGGLIAHNIRQVYFTGSKIMGLAAATPEVIQKTTTHALHSIINTGDRWRGIINALFRK